MSVTKVEKIIKLKYFYLYVIKIPGKKMYLLGFCFPIFKIKKPLARFGALYLQIHPYNFPKKFIRLTKQKPNQIIAVVNIIKDKNNSWLFSGIGR